MHVVHCINDRPGVCELFHFFMRSYRTHGKKGTKDKPSHSRVSCARHPYILEIGTELPLCFRTYVASGLAGGLAGYCMMMMMMMMMMAVAVAVAVAVASR